MLKKFFDEATGLAWTLGGTAMVLITLSGETLKWGLWISGISFGVYVTALLLNKDE
jgi:hypothetical protein